MTSVVSRQEMRVFVCCFSLEQVFICKLRADGPPKAAATWTDSGSGVQAAAGVVKVKKSPKAKGNKKAKGSKKWQGQP